MLADVTHQPAVRIVAHRCRKEIVMNWHRLPGRGSRKQTGVKKAIAGWPLAHADGGAYMLDAFAALAALAASVVPPVDE